MRVEQMETVIGKPPPRFQGRELPDDTIAFQRGDLAPGIRHHPFAALDGDREFGLIDNADEVNKTVRTVGRRPDLRLIDHAVYGHAQPWRQQVIWVYAHFCGCGIRPEYATSASLSR